MSWVRPRHSRYDGYGQDLCQANLFIFDLCSKTANSLIIFARLNSGSLPISLGSPVSPVFVRRTDGRPR